jgi:Complex 1 protein (LYR family)
VRSAFIVQFYYQCSTSTSSRITGSTCNSVPAGCTNTSTSTSSTRDQPVLIVNNNNNEQNHHRHLYQFLALVLLAPVRAPGVATSNGKLIRLQTRNRYGFKMISVPKPTRNKVLSLYRQLLRAAEKMPTPNRRKFVVRKTRTEFKNSKNLTDAEEIQFCIRLADTNLDTVLIQAEHLTRVMKDPNYHTGF